MKGEPRRAPSKRDRERPPGLEPWRGVGSFGTIGLEIALSIALGFFGGRWLDGKLGTAPWLSVLGFVFGIGAAIKAVHRAMTEMRALAEREEREQGNPLPRYDAPDEEQKSRDVVVDDVKDAAEKDVDDVDQGKGDGA